MPLLPLPASWRGWLLPVVTVALGSSLGCLSSDAIPIRAQVEDAGAETGPFDNTAEEAGPVVDCAHDPDHDPLIGDWSNAMGVCSIFSNGRHQDNCGLVEGWGGGSGAWSRLDDGRYYFDLTTGFGGPGNPHIATVVFSEDCSQVTAEVDGRSIVLFKQ